MSELVAIVTGASQGIGRATAVRLAKDFSEQGIKDGIQVNSVVPGPVMTNRRKSFLDKWAPANGMTVEEVTKIFPENVGISRYGTPEEVADLMALLLRLVFEREGRISLLSIRQ